MEPKVIRSDRLFVKGERVEEIVIFYQEDAYEFPANLFKWCTEKFGKNCEVEFNVLIRSENKIDFDHGDLQLLGTEMTSERVDLDGPYGSNSGWLIYKLLKGAPDGTTHVGFKVKALEVGANDIELESVRVFYYKK